MHIKNTTSKVLCLAPEEFSNSLNELKENLGFNLIIYNSFSNDILKLDFKAIIIKSDFLNIDQINEINSISNKPKVLINDSKKEKKSLNYDEEISLPITLEDFNNKISHLIISKEFAFNSSVNIKDFILDKNEKKLNKNGLFIVVREKEF